MDVKVHNRTGQLFAAIDNMDTEGFLTFLTEDVSFHFANAKPVTGKSAVADAVGGFFSSIKDLHHTLTQCWHVDGAAICHGTVTYTRHDSSSLNVPFSNILLMQDGLVSDYRIFVDISELYVNA